MSTNFSDKRFAEVSLYEFFKQSWHVVEGNTPYVHEWYLEEIANALEDCFYRRIKNLLINLPPRKGKSNLISIAFPAWVWLHNPQERILTASFSNDLSLKIADKSRMLIKSHWFQQRWGDRFKIRRDADSKSYFANDKTGCRISTSVGSFVTGMGGSIQITDDPNDPSGESEATIDAINIWWSQKWFNRLNDIANDVRIVVQQRSQSQNDISGNIIAKDIDGQWVKYIVPMEYEANTKSDFKDRRTKECELLSVRDTPEVIRQLKRQFGSSGYAAQYQQRPAPLEGGIIKKAWFKPYTYGTPELEYILQSWDTALTGKDDSSYSACTTWGVFEDQYGNNQVILLSLWRGKIEYPELRARVKRLSLDYMDVGQEVPKGKHFRQPDMILIEAKASGDPLIADLNRAGIYATPFVPNKYGDKIQRVRLVTPLIESGVVWLPTKNDKLVDFANEFVTAISYFPNTDSRDLVDTMTQALIKLKDSHMINHPKDEVYIEEHKEFIRAY